MLGVGTWLLLVLLLRREPPLVRAQVAVVVVFATAVEYTFSPLLEVYVYRLDNVPAFVPPGHGLVYLCALAMGRSGLGAPAYRPAGRRRLSLLGGAYAGVGAVRLDRPDVLGAFWYLCLLGFLGWGRSRTLYVGAFVVVTYLELLGTWLGTWEWQTHDPTGLVGIGNPPSGAAGGYGWFDLAAVLAAPALLLAFAGCVVDGATADRPRNRLDGRGRRRGKLPNMSLGDSDRDQVVVAAGDGAPGAAADAVAAHRGADVGGRGGPRARPDPRERELPPAPAAWRRVRWSRRGRRRSAAAAPSGTSTTSTCPGRPRRTPGSAPRSSS